MIVDSYVTEDDVVEYADKRITPELEEYFEGEAYMMWLGQHAFHFERIIDDHYSFVSNGESRRN